MHISYSIKTPHTLNYFPISRGKKIQKPNIPKSKKTKKTPKSRLKRKNQILSFILIPQLIDYAIFIR